MLSAILLLSSVAPGGIAPQERLIYPNARRSDQVDDYFGVKVADPYRWLEDPDSAETRAWVEAENKVTQGYLDALPGRDAIKARLRKLWNYERFGMPEHEGGRYFFTRNDGLQNQSVLYVSNGLRGKPRVLIDPNKLSKDGTVALAETDFSRDGRMVAYDLQKSGSDWQEWHFRNVETGRDVKDVISWSKFASGSWTKDGKGFFYCRFDTPKGRVLQAANYFHKVFYHRLGTSQNKDVKVFDRPDKKDWTFDTTVTDDGRYLLIVANQGTAREDRYFFKDLSNPNATVRPLLTKGDAYYGFIGNKGSTFWFQTERNSPRGSVIALDSRHPNSSKVVVPQANDTINTSSIVGNRLFVSYLKDAHGFVKVFTLAGKPAGEVKLPGIGTVGGFGGRIGDRETFYSYASYTAPTTIYRYDIRSGRSTVFRKPKVDFDAAKYETRQVFCKSKDGTRIPIFLTYRKGLKMDGSNPTLMYGYGGFAVNETPYFSVPTAVWLEMGGVYADVVLRGGSEYGEAWHRAGMKANKQNVFDDFIAAGQFLIASGVTSTPKLAITGASNGGLLIGAMLTQRPDLWGATIPEVGVMDMLRFNKFTIGWAWMSDYGNPDTKEGFAYISKYSPLLNLKPGVHYPPTLILTADHDDRVVPAHSFKFAATMQADQAGDAPVLIRIETKAGHGGGKPISMWIDEYADKWAFLKKNLNMGG